jgi:hypothetical protein
MMERSFKKVYLAIVQGLLPLHETFTITQRIGACVSYLASFFFVLLILRSSSCFVSSSTSGAQPRYVRRPGALCGLGPYAVDLCRVGRW